MRKVFVVNMPKVDSWLGEAGHAFLGTLIPMRRAVGAPCS